jgi:hypothetical protein
MPEFPEDRLAANYCLKDQGSVYEGPIFVFTKFQHV